MQTSDDVFQLLMTGDGHVMSEHKHFGVMVFDLIERLIWIDFTALVALACERTVSLHGLPYILISLQSLLKFPFSPWLGLVQLEETGP